MDTTFELSDKPVLFGFTASWYSPCKALGPIINNLENCFKDQVKIVKVDVDKDPDAADQFDISTLPTLVLIHKGQVLWKKAGVIGEGSLKQIIKKFI